jgi:hypothetical protein
MKNIIFSLISIIALSSFAIHAHEGSAFAIYLSTSKLSANENVDIEKLELINKPLITDSDIIKYIWRTHEIVLSEEGVKKFRGFIESKPKIKQFVVMADGTRCYAGAFWKSIYSSIYPNPVIIIDSPFQDRIIIERAYPSDDVSIGKDLRNDNRIYTALKCVGKLIGSEETK